MTVLFVLSILHIDFDRTIEHIDRHSVSFAHTLSSKVEMITSRGVTVVIGLLLLTAGLMLPTISLGHIPAANLLKWFNVRDWESVP